MTITVNAHGNIMNILENQVAKGNPNWMLVPQN